MSMALIEAVRDICKRLAPGGWHNLLLHHGLDILAPDLERELRKTLTPDRTLPGFEDFALTGTRGIEPGHPAQSLLYHTLAHANVTTDAQRNQIKAYPTAAELEAVINYVYGCQPPSLQQLKEQANGKPMAVVVFAVEYRPAPDTVHKVHADLCFSRTGISRVGTAAPLYDAKSRGFLPFVTDDAHAIRVLPARYCAYIAVQRKGDYASFGPMRFGKNDQNNDFWVPLHKLFNGSECIAGMTLDIQLNAQHKNEKLRRIHQALGTASGWGEPDISHPPFVITNDLGDWLPEQALGPGWMAAHPRRKLVEAAHYQGKPLSFNVPEKPDLLVSSLKIDLDAPEYVHIRHKVDDAGNLVNLNNQPNMLDELKKGNFKALHYLDFTADGWIQARCTALDASLPIRVNAYSLICAPDFYPLCNQRHLSEWLETLAPDIRDTVFPIRPVCLSDARHPANIQSFPEHFAHTDLGITAIVSQQGASPGPGELDVSRVASALRASCLPDAAAGVFAPGWDIGLVTAETDGGDVEHLAAYRLGSPFPEDAKLCAALSSYWPAVAPDSAQSYGSHGGAGPTIKPMLDHEIGIGAGVAWDGTPAPQKYRVGDATHIAYQAYLYGDYTENALAGKFSLAQTGNVDSQEYQRRVDAFHRVRLSLGNTARDWVIDSFTTASLEDLPPLPPQADLNLAARDHGYRFELIRHEAVTTPQYNQAHIKVIETCTYLVWPRVLFRRQGSQPWQRIQTNE
jgi:hypothetical protein